MKLMIQRPQHVFTNITLVGVIIIVLYGLVFFVPARTNASGICSLNHQISCDSDSDCPTGDGCISSVDRETAQAAQGISVGPGTYIAAFIAWVLSYAISGIGHIIVTLVGILITLGQYNDFIKASAVVTGWNVIRDISNMFFVLILVIISFGTILHVEQYQMKKLLPKVLLMAILINFSKAIAGLFIDFSQVVLLTFAAAYQATGAGNFLKALKLDSILSIKPDTSSFDAVTYASLVYAYLLGFIYTIVALIVIAAFLLIFIIRIAALWLLVIFSPFAYSLSIVPAGQKYAQKWWEMFSKYVIVGPVLAFFLWLSLATLPQMSTSDFAKKLTSNAETQQQGIENQTQGSEKAIPGAAITVAGSADQVFAFLISIAMLMMSLVFAQEIGGAVGKVAGNAYSKIASGGAWMATKGVAKSLGYLEERTTGGRLNPKIWMEAIKDARHYRKERRTRQAAGTAKDVAHYGFRASLSAKFGGKKIHAELAKNRLKEQEEEQARLLMKKKVTDGVIAKNEREKMGTDLGEHLIKAKEKDEQRAEVSNTVNEALKGLFTEIQQKIQEIRKAGPSPEADRLKDELGDLVPAGVDIDNLVRSKNPLQQIAAYKAVSDKGKEIASAEDIVRQTQRKLDTQVPLSEDATPLQRREYEDKRKQYEDELLANITRVNILKQEYLETSAAAIISSKKPTTEQKNSITDAVADAAKLGRERDEEISRAGEIRLNIRKSDKEVTEDAINRASGQASSARKQIQYINDGYLSDDETHRKLGKINEELQQLERVLKETAPGSDEHSRVLSQYNKLSERSSGLKIYSKALGTGDFSAFESNSDAKSAARRHEDEKIKDEDKNKKIKQLEETASEQDILATQTYTHLTPEERRKIEIDIGKITSEIKENQSRVAEGKIPIFYREQARRELVGEELKKVTTSNYEELIQYFRQAQHEGDKYKMSAVLHKLAEDYNENEITNAMGYHSGFDGYKDFFEKEIIGKGKFNRQEAMALATDVSAIAEKRNHWDVARTVAMDSNTGEFRWKTEREHVIEVLAELQKISPRNIAQNFNRLAYGGERPNIDGSRTFELGPLGMAILNTIGNELAHFVNRREMNKNAVVNIWSSLQSSGVPPSLSKTTLAGFKNYAGELVGGADLNKRFDYAIDQLRRRRAVRL